MIHTISTIHFSPPDRKTDLHLQPSSIATSSANHATFRSEIPHNHGRGGIRRLVLRRNNPAAVASSATELESASEVVRKFYDGVNRRELALVEDLIAVNCVYEDLVFPQPFVGRKAILEFFKEFMESISVDLQFAIDDISEDTSAVGVSWHLDWKGKPFPFSKGCSFYRLDVIDDRRQIVYGRDCVEPAIKPGDAALVIIRGVTWLLQKFPSLADRL